MTEQAPVQATAILNDNAPSTTTIIVARPEKSVMAAFFLTLLFGPLGLLYASIAGGIIMIILAIIVVPFTLGIGALIVWPVSMLWAVIAAVASKSAKPTIPKVGA